MSEKVKRLERELKAARIQEKTMHEENKTVNLDFTVGLKDTKPRPAPKSDKIPNVGVNPRKAKNRRENIPFY